MKKTSSHHRPVQYPSLMQHSGGGAAEVINESPMPTTKPTQTPSRTTRISQSDGVP